MSLDGVEWGANTTKVHAWRTTRYGWRALCGSQMSGTRYQIVKEMEWSMPVTEPNALAVAERVHRGIRPMCPVCTDKVLERLAAVTS